MSNTYVAGLDLGQANDYTALVIVEKINAAEPSHYHVRHIERFRLGTPYPKIVEDVAALVAKHPLRQYGSLVIDATGVGRAVVDMFAAAGVGFTPVTITGGDAETREATYPWHWKVPKRNLVGVVQVLLQTDRLRFAQGLPELPTLLNELQTFQVKLTATAHDSYGAWREHAHDDLVLALALALWEGERNGGSIFL